MEEKKKKVTGSENKGKIHRRAGWSKREKKESRRTALRHISFRKRLINGKKAPGGWRRKTADEERNGARGG